MDEDKRSEPTSPDEPSLYSHRVRHAGNRTGASMAREIKPSESAIGTELSLTGALIDDLGLLLDQLQDKLQPVLSPEPPSDTPAPGLGTGSSDLFHNISSKNMTLSHYTDRVRQITRRLEL